MSLLTGHLMNDRNLFPHSLWSAGSPRSVCQHSQLREVVRSSGIFCRLLTSTSIRLHVLPSQRSHLLTLHQLGIWFFHMWFLGGIHSDHSTKSKQENENKFSLWIPHLEFYVLNINHTSNHIFSSTAFFFFFWELNPRIYSFLFFNRSVNWLANILVSRWPIFVELSLGHDDTFLECHLFYNWLHYTLPFHTLANHLEDRQVHEQSKRANPIHTRNDHISSCTVS